MYDDSLHVKNFGRRHWYYRDSGNTFGNLQLKSYTENSALLKSELRWYSEVAYTIWEGWCKRDRLKYSNCRAVFGKLYGVDGHFSFNGSILAKG